MVKSVSVVVLTCTLHLRKGQINLSNNPCHIKASGVAEATMIHGVEAGTEFLDNLSVVAHIAAVTIAISCRCSKSTESKQADERGGLETHVDDLGLGMTTAEIELIERQ